MLKKIWLTVGFSALLAGCSSSTAPSVVASLPPAPAPVSAPAKPKYSCPPLKQYSKPRVVAALAEFKALPKDSPLAEIVTDARNMRVQCGQK